MTFEKFQNIIRAYGGVWAREVDIYFSQTQAFYTARYAPKYPEDSPEDSAITICHVNGMWYYKGPHTENIRQY